MTPDTKGSMSAEHKAALAEGRNQVPCRSALPRGARGAQAQARAQAHPRVHPEAAGPIEAELAIADPLKRLQLIQERLDLTERARRTPSTKVDLTGLEKEFVGAATDYSAAARASRTRPGASWASSPAVLKRAGISRSS